MKEKTAKVRKLFRLYSDWHVTHRAEVRDRYLVLLGEIVRTEPQFNPRQQFQAAF